MKIEILPLQELQIHQDKNHFIQEKVTQGIDLSKIESSNALEISVSQSPAEPQKTFDDGYQAAVSEMKQQVQQNLELKLSSIDDQINALLSKISELRSILTDRVVKIEQQYKSSFSQLMKTLAYENKAEILYAAFSDFCQVHLNALQNLDVISIKVNDSDLKQKIELVLSQRQMKNIDIQIQDGKSGADIIICANEVDISIDFEQIAASLSI